MTILPILDLQLLDLFFLFPEKRQHFFSRFATCNYLFIFVLKQGKRKFYFYVTLFWARGKYNYVKIYRRIFMEPCNIWGWGKDERYLSDFFFHFCLKYAFLLL